MPARLIQHHDAFAKHILDEPGNADAFLREWLPAPVRARLAPTPAVDRSESHISPELRDLRGDRVFALETVEGDEVLVWAMVEHKSAPESDILKQLLTDLTGIACKGSRWRRGPTGRSWQVPAVVIPIILYHGTEAWDVPQALSEAYGLSPELTALGLLTFTYILIDLCQIPDDALSQHPPLRAALMVLKYARYDGDARTTLRRLIEAAALFDLTTLIVVVRYLVKESDWVEIADIRNLVARLMPGEEDKVMSPALREILDEARPQIIDEVRPQIINEARPQIIDEARPQLLDEGRVETLLHLLRLKFGTLAPETAARVRAAKHDELESMTDNILSAVSLEEVFAARR